MKLWDIATGQELRTFKGHSDSVWSVAFSPDSRYAMSGSSTGYSDETDRTMILWDLENASEIRTIKGAGILQSAHGMSFSPKTDLAIVRNRLWDIGSGLEKSSFVETDSYYRILSPNGKLVLTATSFAKRSPEGLEKWRFDVSDVASGRKISTFEQEFANFHEPIIFSPDSKYLLLGCEDRGNSIVLRDVSNGKIIRKYSDTDWFNSIAFSHDGKFIVSADFGEINLLETRTGRKVRTFEWVPERTSSQTAYSVTFSPDGRYILSGNYSGNYSKKYLTLWDIATGREIRTFKGQTEEVKSVAFSPDGKFALSGGGVFENSVKLWDVASGILIRSFNGHFKTVDFVSFTSNGRFALSGSYDGTMRVWDVATGDEIVTMILFKRGDWISITPDGYYNRSPGATDLIHWVPKIGMEVYSSEQFESKYKRPDIIRARLSGDLYAGKPTPVIVMPSRK